VKEYRSQDEYFDNGDTPEDSDCESRLDQTGHSVMETEVGGMEESGKEHLPVLSTGSFIR